MQIQLIYSVDQSQEPPVAEEPYKEVGLLAGGGRGEAAAASPAAQAGDAGGAGVGPSAREGAGAGGAGDVVWHKDRNVRLAVLMQAGSWADTFPFIF